MQFRLLLALLLITIINTTSAGILTSKHNLSISGQGGVTAITALSETRVCVFCHTPHSASSSAPLWNRVAGAGQVYTPYSSSTITFSPGQPTGSSVLCLSCHDGTIALGGGIINGGPITMANGVTTMPINARGNLGLDHSNDHPFSFRYTSGQAASSGGELADPASLPRRIKLDSNSQVQCQTCHDPHDDTNPQFLVISNRGSALCETCHTKSGWTNSLHNVMPSTWNLVLPDPWPNSEFTTVADNGCGNCHAAHNAGVAERLFTQMTEEQVCFVCHNGNVASDILQDFVYANSHPLDLAVGVHQPAVIEIAPAQLRHVECIDCHNAHSAARSPIRSPGINGVDWAGIETYQITELDQLCFKCHESSPNKLLPLIPRSKYMLDVRLQFESFNPSYHPMRAVSRIASQSLLPPWIPPPLPGVVIAPVAGVTPVAPVIAGLPPGPGQNIFTESCFECHLRKPHGTPAPAILNSNMVIYDGTPEGPLTYQLCYRCHDRNIILGNTTFREHSRHIVNNLTSCVTCHTPHGASVLANPPATGRNNLRLINFSIVEATPVGGLLDWTGTGNNTGTCTLLCHGQIHNNETY